MNTQRKPKKNSLWSAVFGIILAVSVAVTSRPATAEPITLTGFAISVLTAAAVKGAIWLFNWGAQKVVQEPDVHFEKTQKIHEELRGVAQNILANRELQIQIHEAEVAEEYRTRGLIQDEHYITRELIESEHYITRELIEGMVKSLKDYVSSEFEMEDLIDVLERVLHVNTLTERMRNSTGKERIQIADILFEEVSSLERSISSFEHRDHLRAAMIPTRIAAMQSRWAAFSVLEDTIDMKQHRVDLVRTEGAWLAKQRIRTGARDPVLMTLSDIIENFEEHLMGVDMYLGSLSDPCSPLWRGYVTMEKSSETKYTATITKIGVSQIHHKKFNSITNDQSIYFQEPVANHPLIQQSVLEWDQIEKMLPEPVKIRRHQRYLDDLRSQVFDCAEIPLSEIPPLVDFYTGRNVEGIPPIIYDARVFSVKPCHQELDCRRHWEFVHMRREIIASMLTMLYTIRNEVNKTLEWLAEETTGAQCLFFRDEPRVCVFFEDESAVTEEVSQESPNQASENRMDLMNIHQLAKIFRDSSR